jgi:hypothetical protein
LRIPIFKFVHCGAGCRKHVNPAQSDPRPPLFEGIKMIEDESFNEFYTKISDLRNSMVSLGKKISDAKLIKKILNSWPGLFRIKATTIEEIQDLDMMKIEELVGSLQTYEFSLPPFKKAKSIVLKAAKGKSIISSYEDTDDEKGIAILAKIFRKLMKTKKFKNKFSDNWRGDPKGVEQDDADKKDTRGPECYE